MLKIRISNNIIIESPPRELVAACRQALTLDNPAYHRNKRMGIRVWEAMRTFKYYKIDEAGGLSVPRGFRSRLLAWCDKMRLEYKIEEFLVEIKL